MGGEGKEPNEAMELTDKLLSLLSSGSDVAETSGFVCFPGEK